jgi:hypothetical protein
MGRKKEVQHELQQHKYSRSSSKAGKAAVKQVKQQ